MKLRLHITKKEEIRFISHLDFSRTMARAIRRSGLPVAYSEGFNPHMKMSFASALAVGVTSDAEYMDIDLEQTLDIPEVLEKLTAAMPSGIGIVAGKAMEGPVKSLMAVINCATYTVELKLTGDEKQLEEAVTNFNSRLDVLYEKYSPKGVRQVDVKQYVKKVDYSIDAEGVTLLFSIAITPTGSMKPGEVTEVLVKQFHLPVEPESALIKRRGLFIEEDGRRLSPLEL